MLSLVLKNHNPSYYKRNLQINPTSSTNLLAKKLAGKNISCRTNKLKPKALSHKLIVTQKHFDGRKGFAK